MVAWFDVDSEVFLAFLAAEESFDFSAVLLRVEAVRCCCGV